MNENCSPHIQAVIFVLIIVFYLIYESHFFKNNKYNKLALAFAILMTFWFITIYIRYVYSIPESKHYLFRVNDEIKCFIGEPGCENSDPSLWTVGHFIVFLLIGIYVPGLYLEIFVISIIFEGFEYSIGHTSRFIIDPIVNLSGYIIGSQLSLSD